MAARWSSRPGFRSERRLIVGDLAPPQEPKGVCTVPSLGTRATKPAGGSADEMLSTGYSDGGAPDEAAAVKDHDSRAGAAGPACRAGCRGLPRQRQSSEPEVCSWSDWGSFVLRLFFMSPYILCTCLYNICTQ